jgi:hypothetical protein
MLLDADMYTGLLTVGARTTKPIEVHESLAIAQVSPPAIDSLFVTAAVRTATPCVTSPRSCVCRTVQPVIVPVSGSASTLAHHTSVPLPSLAPAVKAGLRAAVSATPVVVRVLDAPIGEAESNSPAGTLMQVADQVSEAFGVNVLVVAVQAPVATTYQALARVSVAVSVIGVVLTAAITSPFAPAGAVTAVVVRLSSQAI